MLAVTHLRERQPIYDVMPKDVIGASQRSVHYLNSVSRPTFCHVFVAIWKRKKKKKKIQQYKPGCSQCVTIIIIIIIYETVVVFPGNNSQLIGPA